MTPEYGRQHQIGHHLTHHEQSQQSQPMTSLTPAQIHDAAHAARESILQTIDSYINAAIQGLGVSPSEVSDEQYNEIIDEVFG